MPVPYQYLVVWHYPGITHTSHFHTFDQAVGHYETCRTNLEALVGPVKEHVLADAVGLVVYCNCRANSLVGYYLVRVH